MDSPTSQKLLSRVNSLSIKKSSSPHRHKRAIARSPHTPFPSPAASPAVINRATNSMEMADTDQMLDKYTKKIFQLKTRESYLKKFHDDCEDVLEYLDRQANENKAYCNTFHHFESDFVHYLQHSVTQLFSSTEFANNLEEFLKLLHEFIFQPDNNNRKTPAGATALFGVFDTIPETHLNPVLYSLENSEPWMHISVKEGAKVNGYSSENFIASEIVLDESKSSYCVSVLSKFIHNPEFKTAISGCFYLVNYFSGLLEIDSAAHYPILPPCIQMLVCEATDLLFSGNYERMKKLDILLGELTKMDCAKTHELSEWLKEVSQLASKLVDLDFKYAEATKERLCLALERGNWMMGNNELQDLRNILQKISHSICTTLKDALTTKRKEVKIGMKWQKVLKTTIDSCLSSASQLNEDLWMSILPTFINTVNGCALPPAIHHYNQSTCTLSNLRCELNLDKSQMRLDYGFDITNFESNELLTAVISNVQIDFREVHCWISSGSYQELSNHYFDASGRCTLEIEFNSKPFHLKRVECCAPMQFSNFNIHRENLMVLMSTGAIKSMIENRVEQIIRDIFEESTMTMEESLLYHEQHQRFPVMSRTDTLNSR